MTRRTKPATSVIAWAPAGASFTALALAVGLTRLYGPDTPVYEYWLESLAGAPVFATVGAVIVARRPRNTIGWILSAGAICAALQFLLGQFATLSLAD